MWVDAGSTPGQAAGGRRREQAPALHRGDVTPEYVDEYSASIWTLAPGFLRGVDSRGNYDRLATRAGTRHHRARNLHCDGGDARQSAGIRIATSPQFPL